MRIFITLFVSVVVCLVVAFSIGMVAEFIHPYASHFFKDPLLSALVSFLFGGLLLAVLCNQIVGED